MSPLSFFAVTTYFYPRPPRGGRHVCYLRLKHLRHISIHALREEGDTGKYRYLTFEDRFLSTPSARRATVADRHLARGRDISIHALREEGDRAARCDRATHANFYPRPPRGGRPPGRCISYPMTLFLSTPSARRATCRPAWPASNQIISIHALREEGDMLQ